LTAKPNVVWAADCTSLDLEMFPKIHLFLCIDIHTNFIVTYKTSKKTINSKQVISGIEKAIQKKLRIGLNKEKNLLFLPIKEISSQVDRTLNSDTKTSFY